MSPCSPLHQAARPSWSPANAAAATCPLAGRNFPSNPSRSNALSAASCAGTSPLRSSSVAPTNWSPVAAGRNPVACWLLPATEKIVWVLVAKNRSKRHYIYATFSRRRWRPESPGFGWHGNGRSTYGWCPLARLVVLPRNTDADSCLCRNCSGQSTHEPQGSTRIVMLAVNISIKALNLTQFQQVSINGLTCFGSR